MIANGYPFGGIKENKNEMKELQRVCIMFSEMLHPLQRIKKLCARNKVASPTTLQKSSS
jgi:hypothetical protein